MADRRAQVRAPRRYRWLIGWAAFVASACGCSLLVDFGQYSRGDGSRSDAGGGHDSTEAASTADAAFCEGADFCDEFERNPSDVVGSWSALEGAPSSALSLSTVGGNRTDAGFLHVELERNQTAFLRMPLRKPKRLRVSLALRVFDVKHRGVDIGLIRWQDGDQSKDLFLVMTNESGPQIQLYEQVLVSGSFSYGAALATTSLPTGSWVAILVDLEASATPPLVSFDVNGISVAKSTAMRTSVADLVPELRAGSPYVGPTGAQADGGPTLFDLDDVRLVIDPP